MEARDSRATPALLARLVRQVVTVLQPILAHRALQVIRAPPAETASRRTQERLDQLEVLVLPGALAQLAAQAQRGVWDQLAQLARVARVEAQEALEPLVQQEQLEIEETPAQPAALVALELLESLEARALLAAPERRAALGKVGPQDQREHPEPMV